MESMARQCIERIAFCNTLLNTNRADVAVLRRFVSIRFSFISVTESSVYLLRFSYVGALQFCEGWIRYKCYNQEKYICLLFRSFQSKRFQIILVRINERMTVYFYVIR